MALLLAAALILTMMPTTTFAAMSSVEWYVKQANNPHNSSTPWTFMYGTDGGFQKMADRHIIKDNPNHSENGWKSPNGEAIVDPWSMHATRDTYAASVYTALSAGTASLRLRNNVDLGQSELSLVNNTAAEFMIVQSDGVGYYPLFPAKGEWQWQTVGVGASISLGAVETYLNQGDKLLYVTRAKADDTKTRLRLSAALDFNAAAKDDNGLRPLPAEFEPWSEGTQQEPEAVLYAHRDYLNSGATNSRDDANPFAYVTGSLGVYDTFLPNLKSLGGGNQAWTNANEGPPWVGPNLISGQIKYDGVLEFTVPANGVATVSSALPLKMTNPSGSDGFEFIVLQQNADNEFYPLWPVKGVWQWRYFHDSAEEQLNVETGVAAGDKLLFVVHATGNSYNDTLQIEPVISFAENAATIERPDAFTVFDGRKGVDFPSFKRILETTTELTSSAKTVEAWVKVPVDVTDGTRGIIIGNYNNRPEFSSIPYFNLEVFENGNPRLMWDGGGGSQRIDLVAEDVDVRTGMWTHLAFVRDAAANTTTLYVNGEAEATANKSGRDIIPPHLAVGNDMRTGTGFPFMGAVSGVRLWNVALTSVQIQQRMMVEPAGNEAGLMADWPLDDSTIASYRDLSHNQNHLRIYERPLDWLEPQEVVPVPDPGDYAIAIVPDTQILSYYYPGAFESIYEWLADNKEQENLQFVVGLGDITELNEDAEWERATQSIGILDGVIPYSLTLGNHDYAGGGSQTTTTYRDSSKFNSYFPLSKYENSPGFGGAFEPGKMDNTYHTFSVAGQQYLVLALEFGPRDEVVDWANDIVENHPDHQVIVSTHTYVDTNGTRIKGQNPGSPHRYAFINSQSVNDGEQLWDKLVKKHKNIFLVLSGHQIYDHVVHRMDRGEHGNMVHQFLINGQGLDKDIYGGVAMLGMLRFTDNGQTLRFNYQSLVKDAYLGANNQLELHIDLTAPVITAADRTVVQGTSVDVLENVSATDNRDGAVGVVAQPSALNTASPGQVTVTYTATDLSGNTATKTAVFTIAAAQSGNTGNHIIYSGSDDRDKEEKLEVWINGTKEQIGKATTTSGNGESAILIEVDRRKLEEKLASADKGATIRLAAPDTPATSVTFEIDASLAERLKQGNHVIVLSTGDAVFTVPAALIDIEVLARRLGSAGQTEQIKVQLTVAQPSQAELRRVQAAAEQGDFVVAQSPLLLTVQAVYDNHSAAVDLSGAYTKQSITLADDLNPQAVTTVIIVEEDGSFRHVPTKVVMTDEGYTAQISSMSSGLFALVTNRVQFGDMEHHWARDAVNDMGSRLIVNGKGAGNYDPDAEVTRSEFAAILTRALGLKAASGSHQFSDISGTPWYKPAVQTAYAYGLITGYDDGTFRPTEKLNREQVMTMLVRAMSLTVPGDVEETDNSRNSQSLAGFTDTDAVSSWALEGIARAVRTGIVQGKDNERLAPQDHVTRAEIAVMVQRLLRMSEFIN